MYDFLEFGHCSVSFFAIKSYEIVFKTSFQTKSYRVKWIFCKFTLNNSNRQKTLLISQRRLSKKERKWRKSRKFFLRLFKPSRKKQYVVFFKSLIFNKSKFVIICVFCVICVQKHFWDSFVFLQVKWYPTSSASSSNYHLSTKPSDS